MFSFIELMLITLLISHVLNILLSPKAYHFQINIQNDLKNPNPNPENETEETDLNL